MYDTIERLLDEEYAPGVKTVEAIGRKLIELCLDGDTKALDMLMKRVYPALPEADGSDGGTVVIVRDYTGNRNGIQPQEAILIEVTGEEVSPQEGTGEEGGGEST
jgi:hypothetical protein